jgi:hypothetical protein
MATAFRASSGCSSACFPNQDLIVHTGCVDVRVDDAHCTAVQYALDEAAPALAGYSHKRCDVGQHGGRAQGGCIADGESRVLEVDEHGVVPSGLCQEDHLCAGNRLDGDGLVGEQESSCIFYCGKLTVVSVSFSKFVMSLLENIVSMG